MDCEKTTMLRQLAVDDADSLQSGDWQAHLEQCPACRNEWQSMARSIAIFCQLEREDAQRFGAVANWEAFSRRLSAQAAERTRKPWFKRPHLAGAAGLVLAGGVMGWVLLTSTTAPPHAGVAADAANIQPRSVPQVQTQRRVPAYLLSNASTRPAMSRVPGRISDGRDVWRVPHSPSAPMTLVPGNLSLKRRHSGSAAIRRARSGAPRLRLTQLHRPSRHSIPLPPPPEIR